jgi:site-specific DNA-cytosine methylase
LIDVGRLTFSIYVGALLIRLHRSRVCVCAKNMTDVDFTVLSLCSGYGGLDLGIRLAVPCARTVCYVEREISACKILAARMSEGSLDAAPIWTDLRSFNGLPWRGRVHCIAAGYPCQPFSHAGKREGAKDERHLWPHVERIIGEVEPLFVFLENVEGHLSLGFREVANSLRKMGYQGEAGIFSAEEVGAPHLRKRLFVLAYSAGGRRGELWESSGLDGFIDGRGQKVEDSTRPRGNGPARQGSGRRRGIRETGDGVVVEMANPGDRLLPVSRGGGAGTKWA